MNNLKSHSSVLFDLLSLPFTNTWGDFKETVLNLALALNKYANFLEKSNLEQKERQLLDHPVREVAKHAHLYVVPSTEDLIDAKYSLLEEALTRLDFFEYLCFDEDLHLQEPFKNRAMRYSFFQNLKLSFPVNLVRYDPGGSIGVTVFIWKVPPVRGINEVMNDTMRIVDELKARLPEYHTRLMRREFIKRYCNQHAVNVPKHVLRAIYTDITNDATADQNPTIDARVRQAVLSEDSDLVLDLRHYNKGRPGDTFDKFFELLKVKVDEMTAADERRHGIAHFAKYISVRDLIDDVKNDLDPDVPIPSESSVLFSFSPKNAYLNTARLYTAKVPLQFKVQTRQLRAAHQDDHFCAAQYKYMRHYAVKYRDLVTFISIDDKSKVDFGEPGQVLSTGVRGKKSIVPEGSQLSALDHDVSSKGSITPSVCLNVTIPEDRDGSFYQGKVSVIYKDSIFQASSPWRHVTELRKLLESNETVKPVLMIFSDGGPDHRLTYHSVKLSLIILFKALDLDLLIAGRTAPGHSWLNPVERIMSTLNIALQNTALARDSCTSDQEQVLKSANSMSEIRKKAEKVPGLKEAWIESLHPICDLLRSRTERLSLKGSPFECHDPSSEEQVAAMELQVKQVMDLAIVLGKYQAKDLDKKRGLSDFYGI